MPLENDAVRSRVAAAVNRVLTDSGRPEKSPADDDDLNAELGLDSLDLAVVVVTLEKELGLDPFQDGRATARTFGQLVRLYDTGDDTTVSQ